MGVEDWVRGLLGKAIKGAAESEAGKDAAAKVSTAVAEKAAEKALAEAKAAAARAGDAMLDDLETALLGKKGASDEILKTEGDVDALARARKAYDLDGNAGAAKPPTAAEVAKDREDRARAELAELKKKLGKT